MAAEVFHADARQVNPSVSVVPSTSGGSSSAVRIHSNAVVDEPVVSVVLRATCGSNTSRRYVLLADFPAVAPPSTKTAPTAPVFVSDGASTSLVASTALSLPAQDDRAGSAKTRSRPARATATPGARDTGGTTSARRESKRVAAETRVRKPPERVVGRAVLKLDPMDILSDRIDALDSAMQFTPTPDALLYAKQLESLQGDVKTLKEMVAKNDAKMADLRTKLQRANDEQVPIVWFYALSGLLLLCLATLAALWWRQRSVQDTRPSWWQAAKEATPETEQIPSKHTQPQPLVMTREEPMPVRVEPAMPVQITQPHNDEIDIDLSSFTTGQPESVKPNTSQEAQATGFGAIHSISVEPILDIRQQAEFFVSLGQTERALRILKKQISESTDPNPFVYLDLLALFHSLGLKADFREYRLAFNQHFNGVIPDFPTFHVGGRDLFSYPELLSKLVQTWPSAGALVFLDGCIFRNQQAPTQPSFDLEAFRDLLLLHTLAEEVVSDQAWNPAALFAPDTQPASVGAITAPEFAVAATSNHDDQVVKPEISLVEPPVELAPTQPHMFEESRPRMLDLDFSTFTQEPTEPGKPALDSASISATEAPPPYPERARWPLTKKDGQT
jgi:hypothetical protein